MAHAKYQTHSPQWWVHLRDWKRVYWHRVRRNSKKKLRDGE
jgi:hypothetical protein